MILQETFQRFVISAYIISLFLSRAHPSIENGNTTRTSHSETHSKLTSPPSNPDVSSAAADRDRATLFLHEIFAKYGKNDVMTLDGLEHLLVSLGLGTVMIDDHDVHDHYTDDGFSEFHPDHLHNSSGEGAVGDTTERQVAPTPPVIEGKFHDLGDHQHHRHRRALAFSPNDVIERRTIQKKSLNKDAKKCMSAAEFMGIARVHLNLGINPDAFIAVCPAIIYQLDEHVCHRHDPCHAKHSNKDWHCGRYHGDVKGGYRTSSGKNNTDESTTIYSVTPKVWGMALGSVVVISLCGLCGVAIIPIINKFFYNQLLQFLIALAVGTLTGDALLHLLPHAMAPHGGEEDSPNNGESKQPVWTGLSALAGLFGFFLVEQFVSLYGKMKQRRQVKRSKGDRFTEFGRLSPGGDNKSHDHGDAFQASSKQQQYLELQLPIKGSTDGDIEQREDANSHNIPLHNEDHVHRPHDHGHGHEHGHGHGHSVPKSMSSAAMMVIMGDGLHNFTDGLAIGASFASSLAIGLSTTLAVFCHELPHELGDFAVLLKSGMSVRQALVYNIVSSFLCLLGMVIGVLVGGVESATSWIFTVTAGIFIYIALVDMLPEMTSTLSQAGDSGASKQLQYLLLHSTGIAVGVGVMLLIALYEENIQLSIDGGS